MKTGAGKRAFLERTTMRALLAVGVLALLEVPWARGAGADRSGEAVVQAVCIRCHGPGLNGAPKIGDAAVWGERAAQGLTALTQHAIEGIRNMPPHGGNPGLSDLELERAITYMVDQSGGHWVEPIARVPPERSGEQVVEARCSHCHQSGVDGAPKIGDLADWTPRLRQGLDFLVQSAIHGHGPMQPRGGMADLRDAEVRAAIVYMITPPAARAHASAPRAIVQAQASPYHQVVEGTEIYLGIVPAGWLRGEPVTAQSMRREIPAGKDYYHVNISLFDSTSGAAVGNARVEATVSNATQPIRGGETKKLEPMTFNKITSYGSYFKMSGDSSYNVTVRIRRPGIPGVIEATFRY